MPIHRSAALVASYSFGLSAFFLLGRFHARPRAGGCAAGRGWPRAGSRRLAAAARARVARRRFARCGGGCAAVRRGWRRRCAKNLAAARAAPPCCPPSCAAPLDLSSFLFLCVCTAHAPSLSAHLYGLTMARAAKRMQLCMRRRWSGGWRGRRVRGRGQQCGGSAGGCWPGGRASKAGAPCGHRWAPRRHLSATPLWHPPCLGAFLSA